MDLILFFAVITFLFPIPLYLLAKKYIISKWKKAIVFIIAIVPILYISLPVAYYNYSAYQFRKNWVKIKIGDKGATIIEMLGQPDIIDGYQSVDMKIFIACNGNPKRWQYFPRELFSFYQICEKFPYITRNFHASWNDLNTYQLWLDENEVLKVASVPVTSPTSTDSKVEETTTESSKSESRVNESAICPGPTKGQPQP